VALLLQCLNKKQNATLCHVTILLASNFAGVFFYRTVYKLLLQCHFKSHNAFLCHTAPLSVTQSHSCNLFINCIYVYVRSHDLYLLFSFDLVNDGTVLVFESYSCFLVFIGFGEECFIHWHLDFVKSVFFPAPD